MPSELRPSADLSSWASATPAAPPPKPVVVVPPPKTDQPDPWAALPQGDSTPIPAQSNSGHCQRQRPPPPVLAPWGRIKTGWRWVLRADGVAIGEAIAKPRGMASTTTTSASAIRRCCAALTRGSLFFLLVFLLVLLRFIANLHRRIQFPPAKTTPDNENPSSLAFFFALSLPGLALRFTRKSHQIHTGLISASCAVRR